jgi:GT2 family glycosyltransferase
MKQSESINVLGVIVYYGKGEKILDCIKSLAKQTLVPKRLIIVENSPFECFLLESVKKCLRNTELILIKPGKNIGYAKAVNMAISFIKSDFEFILLLNHDVTFIDENYIERLANLLIKYPKCYGASGLLLFENNLVWSCGALFDPITGFSWHLFWKETINVVPRNEQLIVDYIPFTAALIKRSTIEELGLLDEYFFVYCEDLDFAIRARKHGYFPLVDTSVMAIHRIETGRRHGFFIRYYHQYRGMIHIFIKHFKIKKIITSILFWIVLLTLVETLYLRVHPVYHLLKIKAIKEEIKTIRATIHFRKTEGILKNSRLKLKFRESIVAMIKHARFRGHSW